MKYAVVFAKTDLPGCIATGHNLQETQQMIRGAIEMHLEGLREDGDPIPEASTIADYVTISA